MSWKISPEEAVRKGMISPQKALELWPEMGNAPTGILNSPQEKPSRSKATAQVQRYKISSGYLVAISLIGGWFFGFWMGLMLK